MINDGRGRIDAVYVRLCNWKLRRKTKLKQDGDNVWSGNVLFCLPAQSAGDTESNTQERLGPLLLVFLSEINKLFNKFSAWREDSYQDGLLAIFFCINFLLQN